MEKNEHKEEKMKKKEIRAIFARCVFGRTIIKIKEKRGYGSAKGWCYYAVFEDFRDVTEFVDGPSVKDCLYLITGDHGSRFLRLHDVSSVEIVTSRHITVFQNQCEKLLGQKLKPPAKNLVDENLEAFVGFWNILLGVDPPDNT
jgi:hypothetical protein